MANQRIKAMDRSIFEVEFQIKPSDLIFIVEQHMANTCVLSSGVYVPDTEEATRFLLAPVEGTDWTDRVGVRAHSGKCMAEEHVYPSKYRRIVTAGKIFGADEYTAILNNALRSEDFKHTQARGMEDYVKYEQELADERRRILGEIYDDETDNLAPNLKKELKRIFGE
jgi:hypothetical protein